MSSNVSRRMEIKKKRFAGWFINRFSKWLMKEPKMPPTILSNYERLRYELRPADVLLIEGNNRVSRIIRQITQSNWSHSVLYIGRLYDIEDPKARVLIKRLYKVAVDEQLIIESILGEGTIVRPLNHYKEYHIRICRPQGLLHADAQQVINYAISHLGMRYNIRHIMDLARFLFPYAILPRKWRSSLFQHNALKPTEEICSSMIAEAFQSVHFPILPYVYRDREGYVLINRNPRLITPKDFDYSPYFAIIKYPLTTMSERGFYRMLPWRYGYASDDGKSIYSIQDGKSVDSLPEIKNIDTKKEE